MPDDVNKFVSFLDQLMPFLEPLPPWLKYWVYILVGLIFVTATVVLIFYIESEILGVEAKSFRKKFEIVRPSENCELCLPASKTWLIEGRFSGMG